MFDFDLTGRVALVTGAGQGVGAGIAAALASQGAAVAVNDLSAQRAEQTAALINNNGGTAMTAVADVTNSTAVQDMAEAIAAALGPVGVLVNNAGVPPSGLNLRPFLDTSRADWDPFLSVGLYGVLECTRAVIGAMIAARWGRVVTITSDAGRVGERNLAAYAAAKAGAAGFTRALAKETGDTGVTCNCLSLGWIPKPGAVPPDDARRILRGYAIRRPGRPDDVAAAVVWLASDTASWVTGQTISVSGGYVTT